MKFKIIGLLLLFSVAMWDGMFAQSTVSKRGTVAVPFLQIGMGARAVGMGSSFVAVADDPSAIYWNVAGITKLPGINVMFEHNYWFAGISLNFLAATKSLEDFGTVGFSITTSDVGDMNVTTIDKPQGDGQIFTQKDITISVAYALQFTDKFSIGFNPKFIRETIWNSSATAFALDIGMLYETPFDGFTLGMSITNFGSKIKIDGNSLLVQHDLDPFGTGNNGLIPAEMSTDEYELPLNFRVGVSYKYMMEDESKILANIEATHPNSDFESINLGTEYSYHDFLFLRAGYEELFLSTSEKGLNLGGGLKYLIIGDLWATINYSFSQFGRLNNVQRVGINLSF